MTNKHYFSIEEAKKDLKVLSLQREIALVEIENKTHEMQESLQPSSLLSYGLQGIKKYGIYYLIKRLLFK